MKKILVVEASHRKNGNSEMIADTAAADLKEKAEVTVLKMTDGDCRPCMACAACQGKDTQMCVQKDDLTALLPLINECDDILVISPIYNQQITSRAKLFIERLYPFFNAEMKNMSNTSKFGKKAALICVCWGSPKDIVQQYADWTVSGFSRMGAEQFRSAVFDGIPARGDIEKREDYMQTVHDIAAWLTEQAEREK